jgi:hypothetical protein
MPEATCEIERAIERIDDPSFCKVDDVGRDIFFAEDRQTAGSQERGEVFVRAAIGTELELPPAELRRFDRTLRCSERL